jgi:hypothetical protein
MEQPLVGLVHRNLMDVNVLGAEGSGGMVQAGDGELFFVSRSTAPFLNGVMREVPDGDAAELPDRARSWSFFFQRERGSVVFTWPGDPELEEAALSGSLETRCGEADARARRRHSVVADGLAGPVGGGHRPPVRRSGAVASRYACLARKAPQALQRAPGALGHTGERGVG